MTTLISWDALTDGERIRMLMGRVLGWETFGSWEDYQRKYGAQEYGLGAGKAFTTPTHVAFWVAKKQWPKGEWRVFSPDHEELSVFDPLHNLNDAWLLIETHKFMEVKLEYAEGWHNETERWQSYLCTVNPYDRHELAASSGKTAAEAICRAVYETVLSIDDASER